MGVQPAFPFVHDSTSQPLEKRGSDFDHVTSCLNESFDLGFECQGTLVLHIEPSDKPYKLK